MASGKIAIFLEIAQMVAAVVEKCRLQSDQGFTVDVACWLKCSHFFNSGPASEELVMQNVGAGIIALQRGLMLRVQHDMQQKQCAPCAGQSR